MRLVEVRCPGRGHLLAVAEVHQGYAVVTPRSINVYAGDERQRPQVVDDASAQAGRFLLKADSPVPADTDLPACRCGEQWYPPDLWAQLVGARRAVVSRRR